ncbi:MAG: LLM class flavin-dependent oxidoreductase [Thermomicrobiales bacterium]|nr:LLM class flavin-dependent oxidoreductase [Thermomicrobiales bacterium]MCO5220725.1 LLM class flavin-dependent oxidoreductase [Thermomicrobiales bacterium]
MTYNHDLQFGVFVSPIAEPAHHGAELAMVAEAAGLDLITFQDHPYNPQFLDTWTLIAYAASVTKTIRLAGNVLNLPLRDPVQLATATASLDRLSGGRIELGIGAGAFWDGIGAMGGKKLTAGQSIEALGEGIELIREIWKADEPTSLATNGNHYRVEGVARGPAPAHEIGIWVGAYKPRILRLTGRLADGWLPSLGYLPDGPASLTAMNAEIDAAAIAAGRDPSAIRRMLNINGRFMESERGLFQGPVDSWARQIVELNRDYGISTFILAADDPQTIALFGTVVAPLARELAGEIVRA